MSAPAQDTAQQRHRETASHTHPEHKPGNMKPEVWLWVPGQWGDVVGFCFGEELREVREPGEGPGGFREKGPTTPSGDSPVKFQEPYR